MMLYASIRVNDDMLEMLIWEIEKKCVEQGFEKLKEITEEVFKDYLNKENFIKVFLDKKKILELVLND